MAPENKEYLERLKKAQQERDQVALQSLEDELQPLIDERMKAKSFTYSEAQMKDYTTIGGTPFLDTQYTVFGEVVEGLDVIDKIAAVETGQADRPAKDVKMKVTVIK